MSPLSRKSFGATKPLTGQHGVLDESCCRVRLIGRRDGGPRRDGASTVSFVSENLM